MKHMHITYLHSQPEATLSVIRQLYWPISSRSIVLKVLHKCVVCYKTNPISSI